jgi:hypothetical protein
LPEKCGAITALRGEESGFRTQDVELMAWGSGIRNEGRGSRVASVCRDRCDPRACAHDAPRDRCYPRTLAHDAQMLSSLDRGCPRALATHDAPRALQPSHFPHCIKDTTPTEAPGPERPSLLQHVPAQSWRGVRFRDAPNCTRDAPNCTYTSTIWGVSRHRGAVLG